MTPLFAALKSPSHPGIGGHQVQNIYASEVKINETITLGGFPGEWKHYHQNRIQFETFSLGPSKVTSSTLDQFGCQVNTPNDLPWHDNKKGKDLQHPGGLSGGPALIEITSEGGIVHYELAGIIYEGQLIFENTLVLRCRPAKFICPNGQIICDPVITDSR